MCIRSQFFSRKPFNKMDLTPKQTSRIVFEGLVKGGVKDPRTLANISNVSQATTFRLLKKETSKDDRDQDVLRKFSRVL